MNTIFESKKFGEEPDYLAPDPSEIRLLLCLTKGGYVIAFYQLEEFLKQ
jgi:hypothetical protein